MPAAVIASLAEELGLLSDDTRRVLRGAAVAGDPFEPDLAAAAAGADDATAMAAFDELLDLGLVRPTDVPRRFRFRHPLVRRAVYESAPGGWLLGAHERCAQVLAERGAPAAARAHHVEFAARHGDLAAVAVLTRGRDGGDPSRPRQRRPLVQRRAAPHARRRARRAAGRACCWRGPARSPRRAASPRAMPTCSRASRSPRPRRSACACS